MMNTATILVLCTGNSCRSILAEALIQHLSDGKWNAFSAGSRPTGQVHPMAIATLKKHQIPVGQVRSKSWEEFFGKTFDLILTVCDQAAGEACPLFQSNTRRLHWSIPDPAAAMDSRGEIEAAFENVFQMLKQRIEQELL